MSPAKRQITALVAVTLTLFAAFPAHAQDPKPNILVIMADDIGPTQVSAYGLGIVGYRTPNIDRLANEGMCSRTTMPSKVARPGAPRS